MKYSIAPKKGDQPFWFDKKVLANVPEQGKEVLTNMIEALKKSGIIVEKQPAPIPKDTIPDHVPVKIEIRKGEIVVNDAYMYSQGETVVAIGVDMKSKYAELFASGSDDDIPLIFFAASEDPDGQTLNIDKKRKGTPTTVGFPEYKGWNIWSVSVSRYTAYVCLVKR